MDPKKRHSTGSVSKSKTKGKKTAQRSRTSSKKKLEKKPRVISSRFIPFGQDSQVLDFAKKLKYSETFLGNLPHALSHRTYRHETPQINFDNQKLEFLGDACVGLCVAHHLMELHPDWSEGQLSTARSRLINATVLAQCADQAGIDRVLRIGKGEAKMGESARKARLADAFEAVAGAAQ